MLATFNSGHTWWKKRTGSPIVPPTRKTKIKEAVSKGVHCIIFGIEKAGHVVPLVRERCPSPCYLLQAEEVVVLGSQEQEGWPCGSLAAQEGAAPGLGGTLGLTLLVGAQVRWATESRTGSAPCCIG